MSVHETFDFGSLLSWSNKESRNDSEVKDQRKMHLGTRETDDERAREVQQMVWRHPWVSSCRTSAVLGWWTEKAELGRALGRELQGKLDQQQTFCRNWSGGGGRNSFSVDAVRQGRWRDEPGRYLSSLPVPASSHFLYWLSRESGKYHLEIPLVQEKGEA